VILNSGATDPQLLAHALRVCRKERLEKMIEAPRLEPDPGVLHCHEYFVGFMLNGLISNSRDPKHHAILLYFILYQTNNFE
jgi:hypothetical protein